MAILSSQISPALWLSVTKLHALYLYNLVEKAKDYNVITVNLGYKDTAGTSILVSL
jgi:hypothetical protein